jgi:hypothetical protein
MTKRKNPVHEYDIESASDIQDALKYLLGAQSKR